MDADDYPDDFEKPYESFAAETSSAQRRTDDCYAADSAPSPTAVQRQTRSRDALDYYGEAQDLPAKTEELYRIATLGSQTQSQATISNPYKVLKRIQKENADLRSQLRTLNEQLDAIIEQKTAVASRKPRTSAVTQGQSSDQQLRTACKKLDTIKQERDKIYDKLQRLIDPSYSASLTQNVEELRKKLDRLQRQNRSKSQGQRGREKSLERYAQEDELSAAMKQIIEEKTTIKQLNEKIANAEEEVERMATSLINLEGREEELHSKHAELKAEAEALGISITSEGKRKKQLDDLIAAKEACKREKGVSILSSDTQVKKLKRREAELLVELQNCKEELSLVGTNLQAKQQQVQETTHELLQLNELSSGTDAEYLTVKALRRMRTKSRDISVPLEDHMPRSTKSSEPGSRDPRRELLNVRVRPSHTQSSKSLAVNPAAPKPPLKPRVPKLIARSEECPADTAVKSERKPQDEEAVQRAAIVPVENPYQAAMDIMQPLASEGSKPPEKELPLFVPSALSERRPSSRDSEKDSPLRELPPLKPPYPRDRSHLILREETQDVQVPMGLLERKALRQRSRASETPASRTEELARKAEEKHSFFDEEESSGFSEVQKQLVAVRSEQREEQTQQVVVQYKLQPHQLQEEDLD